MLRSRWSQNEHSKSRGMTEQTANKLKSKGGRPLKIVKRESGIRVRLSKTEYYLIEQKAKQAGMKISDWFRQAAKRAKVTGRFTPEEMKMMHTLTGMANNLNQLTKLAHQQGLLVMQRKCRELLSLIDDTLKYFVRDDR